MNKFLIKHPLVTEKASALSSLGKYVFLVDEKSTAPEIKKAVNEVYKVNVQKVNIINAKDKPRQWMQQRGPRHGRKAGYKKAIVTLKAGQKLDILPH